MTEEATNIPTESPPARPAPPPLRIHHILVATAVVAVTLSFQKWLLPVGGLEPVTAFDGADRIWRTISTSLAFTVVGFAIAWRRAGYPFLRFPGHWLLLIELMPSLVFIPFICYSLMRFTYMTTPIFPMWPFHIYFASTFLGLIGLTIVAAWIGADSRWWRLYFVFQGCVYVAIPLAALVGMAALHAVGVHSTALLALLFSAIIADNHDCRPRDWPHWLGVSLICITIVMTIARSFS
jgi:hypothetical protein